MWRFMVLAFLPGLAFADTVETEAQGCMFSSDTAEVRDCLSEVFYRRGFEMDQQIASVAGSLSGATALQVDVVESKYESDQTAWRVETDETCRSRDVVLRELCRLSLLRSREAELSTQLSETVRIYGGY
ncbi:MAG: hypothetical protein ACFB03_14625 [Paracoccaceae bacterium]